MAQGVNVLEPINEIEVQKDSHHTKINLFIYTLKQQMVRMQTISTNVFLMRDVFKKYTSHI